MNDSLKGYSLDKVIHLEGWMKERARGKKSYKREKRAFKALHFFLQYF